MDKYLWINNLAFWLSMIETNKQNIQQHKGTLAQQKVTDPTTFLDRKPPFLPPWNFSKSLIWSEIMKNILISKQDTTNKQRNLIKVKFFWIKIWKLHRRATYEYIVLPIVYNKTMYSFLRKVIINFLKFRYINPSKNTHKPWDIGVSDGWFLHPPDS